MAEKYRRPLIVFYLKRPPDTGNRGEDFRRAPDAPPLEYDPQLDALIRNVRARHDLARSLLEDEEASPLHFIGSHTMERAHRPSLKASEQPSALTLQNSVRLGMLTQPLATCAVA